MLSHDERHALLRLSAGSILGALRDDSTAPPELSTLPAALREPGACFVTLQRRGQLRGCIGSLHAHRPLALDVWHNARAAAFDDPRFDPLTLDEWPELELELSLLGKAEPVPAASEAELFAALRPGQDGLILEQDGRRATFLPQVWEHFAQPLEFLRALRRKAGLPEHFDPEAKYSRYRCEHFATTVQALDLA
jgi:AmmeMemoRadiSam system protein A